MEITQQSFDEWMFLGDRNQRLVSHFRFSYCTVRLSVKKEKEIQRCVVGFYAFKITKGTSVAVHHPPVFHVTNRRTRAVHNPSVVDITDCAAIAVHHTAIFYVTNGGSKTVHDATIFNITDCAS